MSNINLNIVPSFYLLSDLTIVRAITPVHAGAGRTSGIVDLPIQRDEYGYPCIYSSSLKGALKTALLQTLLRETNDYAKARNAIQVLLGPEPEEGETFESPITILDAYLLAIPVRSLKGIYVYVTSPLLIKRFYERFELFKTISQGDEQKTSEIEELANMLNKIVELKPEPHEAICIGTDEECDKLRVKELEGKVVLAEEYFLDLKDKIDDKTKMLSFLKLDKPLLIVSDENETAKNIVERSILRFTRVRLKRETKTVEPHTGPWTEEYLPPKTILHTIILYKKPQPSSSLIKKILGNELESISEEDYLKALKELNLLNDEQKEKISKSNNILEKIQLITKHIRERFINLVNNQLKGYTILGGHETIGKGITKLEILSFQGSPKDL